MAQTRRKRRTKHRGNAVGMIEVRGRTGRAPTTAEKGSAPTKKESREARLDKVPTWRGAFTKAMFATVLLVLFSLLFLHSTASVIEFFFPVALIGYTLMTYYTDRYLYRRRQRRKATGATR